jgi:hypothetical protein
VKQIEFFIFILFLSKTNYYYHIAFIYYILLFLQPSGTETS